MKKLLTGLILLIPSLLMGQISGGGGRGGGSAVNPTGNGSGLTNILASAIASIPLTNTFFVSTSGNDSVAIKGSVMLPWLSPVTALAAANAVGATNQLVHIEAGFFDIGTNIMMPSNGVSICGEGQGITSVQSETDGTTNGPIFGFNANTILCNLSIIASLNNGTNYQYQIGMAPNTPSTNWINGTTAYGYNLDLWGWSDCAFFNIGNNNLTNTFYARNIHTHSGWDSWVVQSTLNTCTNFVCDLDGFTMEFQGPSLISGAGYRGPLVANGTFRARNGVILFPEGTNNLTNTQVGIRSGAGTTASASIGIFQNIGIKNNLGTNTTSALFADIYAGAGTVNKKSQLILGNIYRIQGSDGSSTAMAIDATPTGSTSAGITWIPNIDPSQISEPTYVGGFVPAAMSSPARAWNFGGTVSFTNGITSLKSNGAGLTTISVTASPFSYTNTSGGNQTIISGGGTVSAITVNGTALPAVFLTQGNEIPLQNNEIIVFTYTVAPTVLSKAF